MIRAHTWSADPHAAAHEHCQGGRVDLERVEDWIRLLAGRYRVAEVAYDPRFFERSAQMLEQEGLMLVPVVQSSAPMADALHAWYQAVLEGRVAHDGDRVLTSHVLGTSARKTDRGWRVSKIRQSQRIDACVAASVAVYRVEHQETFAPWAAVW